MIHLQVSESLLPEGFSLGEDELALGQVLPVDEGLLISAAQETLEQQGVSPAADITLLFSENTQLQDLNRQFLGIDEPTDVLSFPSGEEIDPETDVEYLGDIVISLEQAQAQAAAGGHSLASELQLLIVHGVLHLLGYDHADEEERAAMWAAQAEILERLGVTDLRLE
jgi:probable rRNA maturation factor